MKISTIANVMWGSRARLSYLLIASILLLTTMLGAREIWTQEHRWADIVAGMFYRHDFFHPYLGESTYYDKPLLSYWIIAFIAEVTGSLTTWALRLPSALAGLLAIWSIYSLGTQLKNKQLGFLAGWLLLTTFYFVFWARISSADMLNLGGSLFAVAWYYKRKNQTDFFSYFIFFLILACTSLCKGLTGLVVPIIAVFVDMVLQKSWRQHMRLPLFFAILIAFVIYLLPFLASSYINGDSYGQNGLYLVYRENILRYFQPFDHQDPIYTYFIYLPIYLLPWAIFLPLALLALKKRWRAMSLDSKWIVCTVALLFLFFTVSGSRRSYYVLPMVPFAILFIADWLLPHLIVATKQVKWFAAAILTFFVLLLMAVDILPAWYYSQNGINQFALLLKKEAGKTKPWTAWDIVLLDGESKLNFYLQLPPSVKRFYIKGTDRNTQSTASLLQAWPILKDKPKDTIFISRKLYQPLLQEFFTGYRVFELPRNSIPFVQTNPVHDPIAFIPREG